MGVGHPCLPVRDNTVTPLLVIQFLAEGTGTIEVWDSKQKLTLKCFFVFFL